MGQKRTFHLLIRHVRFSAGTGLRDVLARTSALCQQRTSGMRAVSGPLERRSRARAASTTWPDLGQRAICPICEMSNKPAASRVADVLAGRPICIGAAFHNRQTPSSARQVRRAGSATGLFSRSAGPRRTSQWVETFRFVAGIAMAAEAAAFAEPRCLSLLA